MKHITVLGAIALLVFSVGCGNTADGVKQDTENAAEKTEQAADQAGTKMDGALQTGEVKSALLADTRVGATDINVDTNEATKTVTLNGSVKTEAEKTLAGEVATSKSAGYTVVNNLTIKP